jgi:hypothetical protein
MRSTATKDVTQSHPSNISSSIKAFRVFVDDTMADNGGDRIFYPEGVLVLCTNTPKHLLRCPACKSPAREGRPYSTEHPWAVLLYCSCTVQWVVCSVCDATRDHMRKPNQIRFHSWNKHKTPSPARKTDSRSPATSPAKNTSPARKKARVDENKDDAPDALVDVTGTTEMMDDESDCYSPFDQEQTKKDDDKTIGSYTSMLRSSGTSFSDSTKQASSLSASFAADFFGTDQSRKYFQSEHKERDMGKREIVAKSQFGFTSMAPEL